MIIRNDFCFNEHRNAFYYQKQVEKMITFVTEF